jgi:hypothetical protein
MHLPFVQVTSPWIIENTRSGHRQDPPSGRPDGKPQLQNHLQRDFEGGQEWPHLTDSISRGGQIRTADPLRPRQFTAHSRNALFSTTYVSSRYRSPVEAYGTLLNPEAPSSYKIVYSPLRAASARSENDATR